MNRTAKNHNFLRIGAVLCLIALWVLIPFALSDKTVNADELSDTRIYASLAGAPIGGVNPSGFSEYRIDDDGRRRLSVQAASINLPAGTQLGVFVGGGAAGQMNVDGFGNAFLSIDTNNGQNVPVVNFGNPIEVRQDGAVIVAGTFGTVTPTPSPSGSPTASPSPSGSPTASPSPSASPTASPNASPSPTASPSASPSPGGSPSPSPSPGGESGLFAGLSGVVNGVVANGYAEYELHSSRRELEVRIRQVNLPGGTSLGVTVNNAFVGQMSLDGGEGRLRLRTDNGQNVPIVTNGTTIAIQSGGATILSGVFMGFSGTPSPSPSASPSPTASPSPGESPSPSPSESPNPSPSPTASPSPSPSPSLGRYFEAHPNGSGMTPPVVTGATGEFKIFLSADETQATITGEFHNLSSAQTGARIESSVGTALVHDFGAIGGTNGNLPTATIAVSPAQVQQLRTGLWFAVVTSAGNPGGEISGTLIQHGGSGDFDGDGNNDLAVFRPSSGTWYSQNSQGFSALTFGAANDKLVSGDFDGDGRADAAVFKDVNGYGIWEIKRSSDGGVTGTQFGLASDVPVRGDFDGDGRSDLAVFRPSNGVWYVQKSNNTGYYIVQFGAADDKPMPADMDGDGKDDVLVFRESSGDWFWLKSSTGEFGGAHWGQAGDVPVVGDFDGDGRSDLTVFRPATGAWYSLRSSDGGFQAAAWGLGTDIPAAGNFDGDAKTDIAVFRPSTGFWYILRSSDGAFQAAAFGTSGDIPIVR